MRQFRWMIVLVPVLALAWWTHAVAGQVGSFGGATAPVPTPTPVLPLPLLPTSQASIGDPYYPALGNGGYHVQQYDIAIRADPAAHTISATATISAEATADMRAFNLDLVGLMVQQVTVNNAAAAWSRAGQELTITPTVALAQRQPFTATVRYGGVPAPVRSRATAFFDMGWTWYNGGSYVAGEPEGAATWFPANDHPLDKATYTFRITVPNPYVAVANGVLQQTIDDGTNSTFVWASAHPMASYLATVNIDRFVIDRSVGPNGLPIRNAFPADIVPQARAAFAPVPDMLAYFSRVFGPYPFETYGVVVVNKELPFALETQTLALFGRGVATQAPAQSEDVIAHELAHQWFGDSISVHTWQDIWLNESFATYATWLWAEHQRGPGTANQIALQTYAQLKDENLAPTGNPSADDLFSTSVYERGALVLHAVRLRIGDAAFFAALQAYSARFRDGNASTPDFIAIAERASGQDLHAFFDHWLYEQPFPPLQGYQIYIPLLPENGG